MKRNNELSNMYKTTYVFVMNLVTYSEGKIKLFSECVGINLK